MFYVRAWRSKVNFKVLGLSFVLLFSMLASAFLLSNVAVAMFVFCLFYLSIPILILSSFAFGKHEQVKAEIIKEVEVDRSYEVRRFWWFYAIPIVAFSISGVVTGHYNYLLHSINFLILAFVFSKTKIKVLITDKGLVFGKNMLLSWNEIRRVEVKGDYVILHKGRFSSFAIPKDVLECCKKLMLTQ